MDADAEAAWSDEIRARLDRVDSGTATTIRWSEARVAFTRQPAVTRELEYLEESLQQAEPAARWYAEGSVGDRPRGALSAALL